MSLYLKYRPQGFNSVVGQDHVITTLQNAMKHGALTHAYLFAGPRGTGKTSMARIIAKALNCLNIQNGIEPCNNCDICQAIQSGRLVDLIEIDAASNRGIDEIRELKEKIQFAPNQAKTKVYIIDEVHMLTKEAFNALLKTLEEPPSHAYFILATTEFHKIPETIVSRCQQFNFKRITRESIVQRLKEIALNEGIEADDEALEIIANSANGGLRDAIGLFEQMIIDGKVERDKVTQQLGLSGPARIESFYKALTEKDPQQALEIISSVNAEGQNLNQFVSEFISFLREQMLIGLSGKQGVQHIIEWIDIFSVAKQQINQAIIPQLPIEVAVVKACGFQAEQPSKPTSTPKANKEPVTKVETPKHPDTQEASKKPTSDATTTELSLDSIRQNWKRIMNRIETPFIRMSFMDGEPVKYEKGNLHMAFKSSSFMEKVTSANNQKEIQRAFEDVFGTKVGLKVQLKKVELKPVTKDDDTKNEASVADMAKEVFGS